MDEEYQRMAANSIAHEAFCAGQAWQRAAAAQERPCVLWKPRLFRDGNQWCALLGENIQDGVVGFGDSPDAAMWAFDEAWREKLPPAPGAQPAPSLASDDVSLISEGKTQPAQSVKDVIIDDLQSQFDTEGITEHDSGDALIRLSDAIAAVEDNFTQPAPSVPEDVMRDAERYRYLRARDDETAGIGCWIEAEGRACDRGWLYGVQLDSAIDTCIEMLAAAPEAKP